MSTCKLCKRMYCRDTESGRRTVEPTDLEPGNVASLDVKTAFDVAKPSKVSRILSSTGVHGHAAAALLAKMQVGLLRKL